ncbi:MAG: YceI family protein [Streptomyces sp.]|uniref:YceI family protein n=1 Tax=Streptomyces sp. TaxID=1931 RepID=UPI0025FD9E46|nr:YceI family protein [Streptomyces sp.]MBW8792078.1 YceI family protein [Streptomyces sp.]
MTTSSQPATGNAVLQRLRAGEFAGTWVLDPTRSSVGLRSRSMWGMVPINGSFAVVSGAGTVSASGDVGGTLEVNADSIDTKNQKRDKHLKSADFFHTDKHSLIVFTARRVRSDGAGLVIEGMLQVRDIARPIDIPVRLSASGDEIVQLDTKITIDRSQYGLTWNQMGMASMTSVIDVRAVFVRR